jgi:acylphosphatase
MLARVHMIAAGLVQGVGFRWFVARRARDLGLHGHVRNMPDGSVEIEAAGEQEVLDLLIRDVRRGPRAAHVVDLRLDWLAADPATGPEQEFQIR